MCTVRRTLDTVIPRTQLVLGRQIYWDLIGLSGLDGASVQVSLPAQFRVSLRGGWSLEMNEPAEPYSSPACRQ